MNSHEKAVREAAQKLAGAISEAEAAGLSVAWPRRATGLQTIGISETKKFVPETPKPKAKKIGSDKPSE